MVSIIGVVQESMTVSLVNSSVVYVCSTMSDIVRSVVADWWILCIEALVLSVINLHRRLTVLLDIRRIAVTVLCVREGAVVGAMEFVWDFLKNFLPFP